MKPIAAPTLPAAPTAVPAVPATTAARTSAPVAAPAETPIAAPTAIVFDLFGVIACAQSPAGQADILAAAGVPASRAEQFWRAYWELRPPYDRGRLSGPDYWRSVADAVGATFTPARIAELIAADCGSWRAVDPRMLDLLDVLARRGLTLGLLSNIPPELADEFLRRHAWLDRFAVLGFSCRIGLVKPEPAAFDWCIRALGVEAAAILFVDDREENVRAARARGMQAHLFTDPATLAQGIGPCPDPRPRAEPAPPAPAAPGRLYGA